MAPVTLLTLPTEIQRHIFSYLAVSFGRPDIQSVLRTCRQLYEVALPVSVSVFRNTVPYPKDRGPCSRDRNILFLRLILVTKPWLAKHVETVIFGSFATLEVQNQDIETWGKRQCSAYILDMHFFQRRIEKILGQVPSGSEWAAKWVYDLEMGSSDAQVALILLVCPNIRTLFFQKPADSYHFGLVLNFTRIMSNAQYYFGAGLEDNKHFKKTVPLLKLEDVFHETLGEAGYLSFHKEAVSFFGFPKLKSYECIGAQGTNDAARAFADLPPRSSSVEQIILHSSWATADLLINMLGACRALRRFEFSHRYYDLSDSAKVMMPRDILEAILTHNKTLEELYLNTEESLDKLWDWHDCPERLYMGVGLRQMHALKKLTIGMQELTGMLACKPYNHEEVEVQMPLKVEGAPTIIDCLPENLEYLMIHSCGGTAIVDQLLELIYAIVHDRRFSKLSYLGALFHDWRTNMEDIFEYLKSRPDFEKDLEAIKKTVKVDIAIQRFDAYQHDTFASLKDDPNQPSNLMSRIYAPHFRACFQEQRMNSNHTSGEYGYDNMPNPFEG